MPSPESDDPAGSAYRFVVALYLTVALVGAGAVALAARGTSLRTGAVAVLLGGIAVLAVVGAVVGTRGVPRPLRPVRLYTSGLSWGPVLVGIVGSAIAAVGLSAVDAGTGALLLTIATAMGLALVGSVLRLMARNATCRARLAAGEVRAEWRARPAPGRRRLYYAVSAVGVSALLVYIAVARSPELLGVLGIPIAVAAQGTNLQHCRVTDDAFVFGNSQALRLLDAESVAGVERREDSIRVARRGWRPSLTFDIAEIDDPDAAADALAALARR